MELKETVQMMGSSDYKERFRAEYLQLKIRINGLRNMLEKYKDGTLKFKPSCSYDLLNGQLKSMEVYAQYLEERAEIENIELEDKRKNCGSANNEKINIIIIMCDGEEIIIYTPKEIEDVVEDIHNSVEEGCDIFFIEDYYRKSKIYFNPYKVSSIKYFRKWN